MRFWLTWGVSIRVVEWLCANGRDAVHRSEVGLARLANGDIFAKAAQENGFCERLGSRYGRVSHGLAKDDWLLPLVSGRATDESLR